MNKNLISNILDRINILSAKISYINTIQHLLNDVVELDLYALELLGDFESEVNSLKEELSYMLDNFDEQEIKEYEEIESKFIENKYLIKWNEQ